MCEYARLTTGILTCSIPLEVGRYVLKGPETKYFSLHEPQRATTMPFHHCREKQTIQTSVGVAVFQGNLTMNNETDRIFMYDNLSFFLASFFKKIFALFIFKLFIWLALVAVCKLLACGI